MCLTGFMTCSFKIYDLIESSHGNLVWFEVHRNSMWMKPHRIYDYIQTPHGVQGLTYQPSLSWSLFYFALWALGLPVVSGVCHVLSCLRAFAFPIPSVSGDQFLFLYRAAFSSFRSHLYLLPLERSLP